MRRADKKLLAAAKAALAYAHANPPSDPVHRALVDDLGAIIGRAEGLGIDQGEGQSVNRAVRGKLRKLRKVMSSGVIRHVVTVAQLASQDRPDVFGLVRMPRSNGNYQDFSDKVRGLLEAAKEHPDLLSKHGLATTAIGDLESAVGELDRLRNQILASQRGHLGATNDIDTTMSKLAEQLAVLDSAYRYQFANAPERLATWNDVRKVITIARRKDSPTEPPGEKAKPA